MKVVAVIPARYASTRLPGKVLADIHGKPMIQHVWEQVKKSRLVDEVLIACDDPKVEEAAKKFQAKAVMTSPKHTSGTDRIAEAVKDLKVDIVLNIQGDEPLVHCEMVDLMAKAMLEDKSLVMATVVKVMTDESEVANPNVVKVVLDKDGNALYFSRSPIPYNREKQPFSKIRYYKHFGLYAYRKNFLMQFKGLPVSLLEDAEKLEQLRVLEAGYRIKVVQTKFDTVAVDTQEDLERVRELIKKRN